MTDAADPSTGRITCTVDGAVAHLVIDNVGKHNAVTGPMWDQVVDILEELRDQDGLRVVTIRGAGGVFSSGADLNEVLAATQGREQATRFCERVARALLSLVTFPHPTVAVLERHVAGGGAEIAVACDLRVAREDVTFQIPMATLGVVPDGVTARRLAQIGGPGTARSVLLQGRALNAQECLRRGLVQEVLGPEELDQHVLRMVHAFASSSCYSVTRTKAMLLEQEAWGGRDRDVQDLTSGMVSSFLHGDVAVNARAFLERRGPRG